MSGHWIQEGLALVAVATAAAWLIRKRLTRTRAGTTACAGCSLEKAHQKVGAASTGTTPKRISSAGAVNPRPSGYEAGLNRRK